ncbi:MAG: hypothetical protein KAQ98_03290 [Bacteriovoracaceae bacterium]|nr:hypothetical protein [Bacteriovoracaceae bacterium]
MNIRFLLILIYITCCFHAAGATLESIEASHKQLFIKLEELNIENVEDKKLKESWEKLSQIIFNFRFSKWDRQISFGQNQLAIQKGRMFNLITSTFNNLLERNRIFYINEELLNYLGIKNYLCKNKKKNDQCKKMNAFYIPHIHSIFIDKNLPDNQFSISLMHEIIHAFQYEYRFPLDISKIIELTEKKNDNGLPRIKKGDELDYLSFYYEAQANWYQLVLSQADIWLDETTKTSYIGTWVKAWIDCFSLTLLGRLGNKKYNKYLPEIDHSSRGHLYWGTKNSAFFLSELAIFKNTSTLLNFSTNLDFKFHKKFAKALEYTYFDNLNFLFQKNNGDQLNFKLLTDIFYSRIVHSAASEFNNCQELLNEVRFRGISPFMQWLKLSTKEYPECKIYNKTMTKNHVEKIIYLFQNDKDSPFRIFPGSEGTRLELEIIPSLYFHPQFDIVPMKTSWWNK